MLVIPTSEIIPILLCLYLCFTGLDRLTEPIARIILKKKFDFTDAMAQTVVGLSFLIMGAIALAFLMLQIT